MFFVPVENVAIYLQVQESTSEMLTKFITQHLLPHRHFCGSCAAVNMIMKQILSSSLCNVIKQNLKKKVKGMHTR